MSDLLDFGALDTQYGLPSGTLFNLAGAESSFNPSARSPTGPQGLFQQTAGFQGLSSVNTDPLFQANAAGAFLSPYAAAGNLGGGLAAYTEGVAGGAGLSQSPQYINEAAKGNLYAQNLLDLSGSGAPSTTFADPSALDSQDFSGASVSAPDQYDDAQGMGPNYQDLSSAPWYDPTGLSGQGSAGTDTSPTGSVLNPLSSGAAGGDSAFFPTIFGDIENLALRGGVILAAIVIGVIGLIAMMKHQSPVTVAAQGTKTLVKHAKRITEVAAA